MGAIKEKTVVTSKLQANCPTHARSEVTVRDTNTIVDEPPVRGGTDMGPTPTETFVAALIGCTNVVSNRIAEKMGLEFHSMKIETEFDFDRRGPMLEAEVDVPFTEVRMEIHVVTDASQEQLNQVKSELAKYCPIAKMFQSAGTKIVDNWHPVKP